MALKSAYLDNTKDQPSASENENSIHSTEEERYIKVKLIHKSEEGIEIVSLILS